MKTNWFIKQFLRGIPAAIIAVGVVYYMQNRLPKLSKENTEFVEKKIKECTEIKAITGTLYEINKSGVNEVERNNHGAFGKELYKVRGEKGTYYFEISWSKNGEFKIRDIVHVKQKSRNVISYINCK